MARGTCWPGGGFGMVEACPAENQMRAPTMLGLALALQACKPDDDTSLPPVDDTAPPEDTGWSPPDLDVDGYWAEAPDTETRLAIFDQLWTTLGASYASFAASGVDWDAIRETYRPLVEAAESQGRFFQLLGDIFLTLQDGHSYIVSYEVCRYDATGSPPALRLLDGATYSGACLTPLEDDSLLVTRVDPDNPAGLVPGDRVLGYDGWAWRHLRTRLVQAGLPVCGYHSSADLAQDMNWQSALLNNHHLFDTLDLHRHGEAEPERIDTEIFAGFYSDLVCSDQLPVEGVELPYTDYDGSHGAAETSWGVLEGTNIGYIYVYAWSGDVTTDFGTAVSELMGTDGLIIDQRYNNGGGTGAAMGGLALLFQEDVEHIMNCAVRDDPDDYTSMAINSWGWHAFEADPSTYYDRPIAVLVGPRAISAGDLFPVYMTHHPRARRFGRTTDGSFGSIASTWAPDPYVADLYMAYTYAACIDPDMSWLQGAEAPPETEVWLDPEDVAEGRDTVVEAALAWIEGGGDP